MNAAVQSPVLDAFAVDVVDTQVVRWPRLHQTHPSIRQQKHLDTQGRTVFFEGGFDTSAPPGSGLYYYIWRDIRYPNP
ncbi:hypothetical protein J7337_001947 [Fusarium musae]|uniref:Uncharacterized protein n=1 Tax=Fusarium musae TaxID=1042133 RepID=A0A9P8IRQ5_9HYPO|nr:hypothetical protein J7337_001947 [Fusarium musae]KAG9504981.1 hypothetical protein J7337_001947 [Fusarium musae]